MKRFTNISQHQAVTALRFLYPLWAVLGIVSLQYIPSGIFIAEDAAKTFNNLTTNQGSLGMSIAGSLIVQLIHIIVVLVLYQLFKGVNKKYAMLVVILGLVGVPIAMFNEINHVAALILTSGTEYLKALESSQLQSLVMFFHDLYNQGVVIASIFWGLWLIPQGYLIIESKYFPKIFGRLMILAGIGYFLGSFMQLLMLKNEAILSVFEILIFGEVVFMLWVVIKGAKLSKAKSRS
ncbi:DUF4386 domain-containing protein [Patescibacteria group bacterium]